MGISIDTLKARILERAGSLAQQEPHTPPPSLYPAPKVQGCWDEIVSFLFPKNEVTSKRQFRILPTFVENWMGRIYYGFLLGQRSMDHSQILLVQNIFSRLQTPARRPDLEWDLQLVKKVDTINAWALPGGKIAIYEGLIRQSIDYVIKKAQEAPSTSLTSLSEEALSQEVDRLASQVCNMIASTIAHEMAHTEIGHLRSRVEWSILFAFLFSFLSGSFLMATPILTLSLIKMPVIEDILDFFLGVFEDLVDIFLPLLPRFLYLSHSRRCESEADEFGMKVYMQEAGFDTEGMIDLLDMFKETSGVEYHYDSLTQKMIEFLSTHPLSSSRKERARQIQEEISLAKIVEEGRIEEERDFIDPNFVRV